VKQGNGLPYGMRRASVAGLLLLMCSISGWSQESSPALASSSDSTTAAIRELQQEVKELKQELREVKEDVKDIKDGLRDEKEETDKGG